MTSIIVNQNYGHNLIKYFEHVKQKKPGKLLPGLCICGAEGQNRTADTGIFSPLLYRLSYLGTMNPADMNT